jgi:hypothetical protein
VQEGSGQRFRALNRPGPAPFGTDVDVLGETADTLGAALGDEFETRVAAGTASHDDEVVRMTLSVIEGIVGPLGIDSTNGSS